MAKQRGGGHAKTEEDVRAAAFLGRAVAAKREALSLSANTLARRVGISREGVRKIEDGARLPSWVVAAKLALALGLDLRDMLDPSIAVADYTPEERYKPRKDRKPKAEAPPAKKGRKKS